MEEIDLKELFNYFKHKISWIIITVVLIIGIGNIFTILTREPMYKSNTTIVLVSESSQENTYNTSEQQLNKNLVGTYSEIIKSRKVLNQVINNLNLDITAQELSKNIYVQSVNDTEIIRISVANPDNHKATKIANEIASVFTVEIQKIYKLNNVSIVDKAQDSLSAYNVNYLKDNAIYVIIGLVLSCGVIFIRFYFDTTIKQSEDIENKLGLTVLGIVPKVEKE